MIKIKVFIVSLFNYIFLQWIMFFPSHTIRLFFLKRILYKIGSQTTFLLGVEIRSGKNISVGNNSVINAKVLLDGRGGKLIIGDNVDIAQETNIWTLEHDPNSDHHSDKGGNVIIEDYVWIASRVTILPGITIGRGAVVATGSVVTKDVEPMCIVGGVPAKVISTRRSKLQYKLNYRRLFR